MSLAKMEEYKITENLSQRQTNIVADREESKEYAELLMGK